MVNATPARARVPLHLRLVAGLVGIGAFCAFDAATAAPPPNADPMLGPWFRSLTSPVILGESCCNEADGHILSDNDWRETSDGYEIRVDDTWWPVPPQTVLNHVSNPTGGAVAFWETHRHGDHSPKIYCFVRPPEG